MSQPVTEETLLEIEGMIDDIKSRRDVRPDSVIRAVTLLVKEVRRLRDGEEPVEVWEENQE